MENNQHSTFKDVYSLVNERIIGLLEEGIIPWRLPWTNAGLPRNLITQRPFRGINVHLLNAGQFERNYFLTFEQLKSVGGSVLKDEKGTLVVYTKKFEAEEGKSQAKSQLRYYYVFNISQCKDIPDNLLAFDGDNPKPLKDASSIVADMLDAPPIQHKKAQPFYDLAEDLINMPRMNKVKDVTKYYSLLFPELIHATGHSGRLNRKEIAENVNYRMEIYSVEKLAAEIGACYLKSFCGHAIEELEDEQSFITSWINILKADKRMLIKAASYAQRAVEYILQIGDEPIEKHNDSQMNVEG